MTGVIRFQKVRNVGMHDKYKNFKNMAGNSYGPIIINRENVSLFLKEGQSLLYFHNIVKVYWDRLPITVAARSKTWTVFVPSDAGAVGSNPTRVMDVCVRLFCVCAALSIGRGLATGWYPVQGVLPTLFRIKELKKRPSRKKGYRAITIILR
jgi:hypothetical protein